MTTTNKTNKVNATAENTQVNATAENTQVNATAENTAPVMNLLNMVAEQGETSRSTNWLTFDSRKKFSADAETIAKIDAINNQCTTALKQLRNVIAIAVNKNYKSIVLTMYYSNTKVTEFIVVDVATLNCERFSTIKSAKQSAK